MAKEILEGLGMMSCLVVMVMVTVIIAMTVDFVSGWRKAKIRGDEHTSYAASRTLTKFLIYEGMCIIGGCMDFMVHFAWWQFMETTYAVPILTIAVGIILCIVEAWSVKEKAEDKQRKQIESAALVLGKIFGNEAVKKFVEDALKKQVREKNPSANSGTVSTDDVAILSQHTELDSDNF